MDVPVAEGTGGVKWCQGCEKYLALERFVGRGRQYRLCKGCKLQELVSARTEPQKACTKCGETKPLSTFRKDLCHKDGRRSWCRGCERVAVRTWQGANREIKRQIQKKAATKLRVKCIEALGGACACCGETRLQFLAIDHARGDGAAERRALSARGAYKHIQRLGFPRDRYRILCHNCNQARGLYGYCCENSPLGPAWEYLKRRGLKPEDVELPAPSADFPADSATSTSPSPCLQPGYEAAQESVGQPIADEG